MAKIQERLLNVNKFIRIIIVAVVCFGSFNLVRHAYTGRGDKEVDLIILFVGLVCAGILLATSIIQKSKTEKVRLNIKPIDYGVIAIWIIAITLALNESKINRSVHGILDLKRNLLVFEVVNWVVIFIFLIAIGMLMASLFMFNRSRKRSYSIGFLVTVVCSALAVLALTVPIETVRVGSCGGSKETRLSLLRGDRKRIEIVRQQVKEQNQKIQQMRKAVSADGIIVSEGAAGCSIGPVYVLYLL